VCRASQHSLIVGIIACGREGREKSCIPEINPLWAKLAAYFGELPERLISNPLNNIRLQVGLGNVDFISPKGAFLITVTTGCLARADR
jgi:hypothetical protein